MKHLNKATIATLAFASAAIISSGASATTLTTTSVLATADANGSPVSNNFLPSALADSTSTVGGQIVDIIHASANQRDDGFSRVEVNVSNSGYDAIAASGSLPEITASAIAERTAEHEVAGFAPATGSFDFSVSNVMLEVFHGGGGPLSPEARVFFTAEARIGGTILDSFNADMTLLGNYNDFQITQANGFSGTVQRQDCYMGYCQRGVVNTSLTGSLNFGTLLPGSIVEVYTYLAVDFSGVNGTEIGARAIAQDPNVVTLNITQGPTNPSAVPLPAAGWMLLVGLGVLSRMRRRG